MRRAAILLVLGLFVMLGTVTLAFAHCEIPCGIYDDHARVHMIEENITTIEKSMKSIRELQAAKPTNNNQLEPHYLMLFGMSKCRTKPQNI